MNMCGQVRVPCLYFAHVWSGCLVCTLNMCGQGALLVFLNELNLQTQICHPIQQLLNLNFTLKIY